MSAASLAHSRPFLLITHYLSNDVEYWVAFVSQYQGQWRLVSNNTKCTKLLHTMKKVNHNYSSNYYIFLSYNCNFTLSTLTLHLHWAYICVYLYTYIFKKCALWNRYLISNTCAHNIYRIYLKYFLILWVSHKIRGLLVCLQCYKLWDNILYMK